jgi:hypothetical protein
MRDGLRTLAAQGLQQILGNNRHQPLAPLVAALALRA